MASRQAKYDRAHTVQVKMKLNKRTDADVIERLSDVGNKQGYIKDLIRQDVVRQDEWGEGDDGGDKVAKLADIMIKAYKNGGKNNE